MSVIQVVQLLIELKRQKIESYGGQEAWEGLTANVKAAADVEIVQEIGKWVFELCTWRGPGNARILGDK